MAEALRGCTLEALVLQHPAGKAAADLRATAAQERGTKGRIAYEQAMQLEEQATGLYQCIHVPICRPALNSSR